MDLMIASISQHHSMVLVTNNTRHFERIKSLAIENWASGAPKH
jgi:tRNA(fMet)-specific endonuclease VapC